MWRFDRWNVRVYYWIKLDKAVGLRPYPDGVLEGKGFLEAEIDLLEAKKDT